MIALLAYLLDLHPVVYLIALAPALFMVAGVLALCGHHL
jgi:hypothetical protein